MTQAASAPEVSIIIVNWNVEELLDTCLKTIQKYTTSVSYEVIVVDSASQDGSVEMVKKKYPWVKLFAEKINVGFTKGNNIGLREAQGKHILYLNPDIELIEDAIGPMVRHLEDHPKVGAIGCKLLNADRTHQDSIGHFTRLSNLFREYFLREKSGVSRIHHPDTPQSVDVVLGACILVRGDLCREIGGFDERYFMYHEETDLCLSLHNRGFQVIYFPTVAMIHHGSKSSTRSHESRQRTLHENRKSQILFFRKHYSWPTAQAAKLLIFLGMVTRLPIIALQRVAIPSQKESARYKLDYYTETIRWLLAH